MGELSVEWGGKVRPFYKRGDHRQPGDWRLICCAVTEAKLLCMVIFGSVEQRLYEAAVVPDNLLGSVSARSAQEAGFLYDMYLDDQELEAFMAFVDVKGAFSKKPHRLIGEVGRQPWLPYGDLIGESVRRRSYASATLNQSTGWVTPGNRVPQGSCAG